MSVVGGHRVQLGATTRGVRVLQFDRETRGIRVSQLDRKTPCIQANSGGPASRRRTERVVASVLRDYSKIFHLQRVIRVGLHFDGCDPLQAVLESLARVGLDDAEALRERFDAPRSSLLARVVPDGEFGAHIGRDSDEQILAQALLLGLCTGYHYDPSRPVLWTRASLTRRVELFEPAGFYA